MRLNFALALLLILGLSPVISSGGGRGTKRLSPPAPQFGTQCQNFGPNSSDECGTGLCGYGSTYQYSNGFTNGSGIQGLQLRTHTCKGPNELGNCVDSQAEHYVAENDSLCCDQDHDGYNRAACGGNDCDDTPNSGFYINPGRPEICGDGIDNDCQNGDETCPPSPCPNSECNEGGNGIPIDYCTYPDTGCPWNYNNTGFCCMPVMSPIIVDVDGAGFHLTSADDGVWFDFFGTGTAVHISWTAPGSTNAWLALDRNGDGLINNATELFGNITPQPTTANPQGFLALAEYDKPAWGGNGDGVITKKDGVFPSLLLWQDTSHDGVSQLSELHTLHDLGLKSISLDYKESKRTDQYGNRFRYRAKVKDTRDAQLGRWAWDVFLVSGQ